MVCRGGLIDLAGIVYLRSLSAALLLLVGEDDEWVGASNRRALRELACPQEMKLLPAEVHSPDSAAAFECIARETAHWFVRQLPQRTITA